MTVKVVYRNGKTKRWRWRNAYVTDYNLESTKLWTRIVVFFRRGKAFHFGDKGIKTIIIDRKDETTAAITAPVGPN